MLLCFPLLAATALAAPDLASPSPSDAWMSVSAPAPALHLGASPFTGLAVDGRARFPSRVAWHHAEARVAYVQGLGVGPSELATFGSHVEATFGSRFGLDRGVYGGLGVGGGIGWGEDGVAPRYAFVAYTGYAFPVGERVRLSPEVSLGTVNALSVRVEWGG